MAIDKDVLDQLLAGRDPQDLFARDGLLDELKKALSARMLSAELLVDTHELRRLLGDHGYDAQVHSGVIEASDVMAAQLRSGSAATRQSIIATAVDLVSPCSDYIFVTLAPAGLLGALGYPGDSSTMLDPIHLSRYPRTLGSSAPSDHS